MIWSMRFSIVSVWVNKFFLVAGIVLNLLTIFFTGSILSTSNVLNDAFILVSIKPSTSSGD